METTWAREVYLFRKDNEVGGRVMTQEFLALAIGVARLTVLKWEAGSKPLPLIQQVARERMKEYRVSAVIRRDVLLRWRDRRQATA